MYFHVIIINTLSTGKFIHNRVVQRYIYNYVFLCLTANEPEAKDISVQGKSQSGASRSEEKTSNSLDGIWWSGRDIQGMIIGVHKLCT